MGTREFADDLVRLRPSARIAAYAEMDARDLAMWLFLSC
jgi:hypothetical protein